jgi:hypothetical protein
LTCSTRIRNRVIINYRSIKSLHACMCGPMQAFITWNAPYFTRHINRSRHCTFNVCLIHCALWSLIITRAESEFPAFFLLNSIYFFSISRFPALHPRHLLCMHARNDLCCPCIYPFPFSLLSPNSLFEAPKVNWMREVHAMSLLARLGQGVRTLPGWPSIQQVYIFIFQICKFVWSNRW